MSDSRADATHRATGIGDDRRIARVDGSALVEAVVGIGLLAVLVGATLTSHRAATTTLRRGEERAAAVRLLERAIESPSPGLILASSDIEHRGTQVSLEVLDQPDAAPCASSVIGAGPGRRVIVGYPDASMGETVLRGRDPRGGRGPDGTAAVRVHLPGYTWRGRPAVELHGADGPTPGFPAKDDCWEFRDVVSDTYEVIVRSGDASLIDRTHVLLAERPVRVGIGGGTVDIAIVAAEPSLLSVIADADGARLPDGVHPGVLGWLVDGDDARRVTALGGQRPVHPGRVSVIVSACANPDAPASRRTFEVVDPVVQVAVPLAIVTVSGIAGRGDATLELVRRDGCADGTGLHPALRWVGGLSDGMRIALPGGAWQARLLSSSGTRLTGAVDVLATTSGGALVLP